MDRFQILSVDDAIAKGYREPRAPYQRYDDWNELYDFITEPPKLVADDRMEPEDVNFYRDLGWVVKLLNEVNEGG